MLKPIGIEPTTILARPAIDDTHSTNPPPATADTSTSPTSDIDTLESQGPQRIATSADDIPTSIWERAFNYVTPSAETQENRQFDNLGPPYFDNAIDSDDLTLAMIRHTVASVPIDDDMPPLIESDDSDNDSEPTSLSPAPKRRSIVPDINNHNGIDTIPDFHTQPINYYLIHQDLCFANTSPSKPMLLILQIIARRIEITWFINHPKTPPSFIYCLQTVFENERLMVAVRLEAIRRQVGIHIITTEKARLIGRC